MPSDLQFRSDAERLGFLPSFQRGSQTSSRFSDLICRGDEWDFGALAVFFRLGFFLGEDTALTAIKAAPPPGGIFIVPEQRISRGQAIDNYVDLFRKSMGQRLLDGPFAVPLSGGRDSRHILLELLRLGRKPQFAITMLRFPPKCNDDVLVAAELCARAGVPHRVFPQTEDGFTVETRKNHLTNFCTDEHQWTLALADRLGELAVPAVYDGIGGDILSSGLFQTIDLHQLLCGERLDEVAERLMPPGRVIKDCFALELSAKMNREVALQRLHRELRRHVGAANPLASFYFWNRTRREIARVLDVYGDTAAITPFLDNELFRFLSSLPAEVTIPGDFHTETILRAYPEFAHIRFEAKGGKTRNLHFYRTYARKALAFLWRSDLVRTGYKFRQILRCAVDPTYGDQIHWVAPRPIFLEQLRRLIEVAPQATS